MCCTHLRKGTSLVKYSFPKWQNQTSRRDPPMEMEYIWKYFEINWIYCNILHLKYIFSIISHIYNTHSISIREWIQDRIKPYLHQLEYAASNVLLWDTVWHWVHTRKVSSHHHVYGYEEEEGVLIAYAQMWIIKDIYNTCKLYSRIKLLFFPSIWISKVKGIEKRKLGLRIPESPTFKELLNAQ